MEGERSRVDKGSPTKGVENDLPVTWFLVYFYDGTLVHPESDVWTSGWCERTRDLPS